jgi:dTMP kinase
MFICIEGCEGTGKTTQASKLHAILWSCRKDIVLTHEPGSTPLGEVIRKVLKTTPDLTQQEQFELFHAARVDHVNKIIKPCLLRDWDVICDRYYFSTFVYQNNFKSFPQWYAYFREVDNNLVGPNVVFILDMDPEKSKTRLDERNEKKDHWDNETLDQMNRKRRLFKSLYKNPSIKSDVYIIDADRDREVVTKEILGILERDYGYVHDIF